MLTAREHPEMNRQVEVTWRTLSTRVTNATTFSNYILIVYSYSKISKLYGKYKIATEEVMDKLDMFQYRYG